MSEIEDNKTSKQNFLNRLKLLTEISSKKLKDNLDIDMIKEINWIKYIISKNSRWKYIIDLPDFNNSLWWWMEFDDIITDMIEFDTWKYLWKLDWVDYMEKKIWFGAIDLSGNEIFVIFPEWEILKLDSML